jgi:hypothetical protein
MTTLTVRVPNELDAKLRQAAKRRRTKKAAIVRAALTDYLSTQPQTPGRSCHDLAKHLAGCLSGGPRDLSSNKRHLEGYGA